ncbi:MAG: GNAT family N-acetyltransferase [Clostridia bacterium]|nr:GNAT family N-acetyltransferase [Clostridia bacterium]
MGLYQLFRRAEFTDGVIDLIPVREAPPSRELGFGHERVWRIAEHGRGKEIGRISYRDGESLGVYYYGHIGYHVDGPWRGHHYARRACGLIREEIRRGGKSSVVITCDPDNIPSRKTCEALGCSWESRVSVDEQLRRRFDISPVKDRYIWILGE